eukprot:TRINITY_DN41526_c0_g1_i1.p1 TRINITY_DN41526_c0_g1~~TRINITY_DN41526_c0_g1_i1.p1  ORF type:complete len:567 (+),score=108.29 TRINITY_DN41526_c0_g1_i1:117-1817(+)
MVVFDPNRANQAGANQLYSLQNFEGILESQLSQVYEMVVTHHQQLLFLVKHNIEKTGTQPQKQQIQDKKVRAYSFAESGGGVKTSLRAAALPPAPKEDPKALLDFDDKGSSSSSAGGAKTQKMPQLPGAVGDSDEESTSDSYVVPDITLTDMKKKEGLLDLRRHMKEIFVTENDQHEKLKKTGLAQQIVRHRFFEFLVLAVICTNSVWIGVDANFNQADLLIESDLLFIIAENSFCAFFCIELLIRFASFQSNMLAIKDFWFVFDTILVLFMVFEVWVMTAVTLLTDANLNTFSPAFLRLIRVLKFCRMARVVRLLRSVPEILILLKGVAVASRAVFFSQFLVVVIIYIFAIAYLRLLEGTDIGRQYFPDLGKSMLTLMFRVCFFEGLPDLTEAMFKENPFLGILLMIFVVIAPLTALNLLVGILVQVVQTLEASEKEEGAQIYLEDAIMRVFSALDQNGDGMLDIDEFQLLLKNESVIKALADCGLDVLSLAEHPEVLYKGEESLTLTDFIRETLALRSDRVATIKDLFKLKQMILTELEGMMMRSTEVLFSRPSVAGRRSSCGK